MSRAKINEFLQRAKNVTNVSEKVNKSHSPISRAHTFNSQLSNSFQKQSISPVSYQSFTSNNEGPSKISPKKLINFKTIGLKTKSISPNFRNSEPGITKLEVIIEKFAADKGKFRTQIEKHLKSEDAVAENLTSNLQVQKKVFTHDPKVKIIEEKYKKRYKNIVEVFKAEALKTDSKLNELRNENEKLKMIASNPQLPKSNKNAINLAGILKVLSLKGLESQHVNAISDLCYTFEKVSDVRHLEKTISNWFDCLKITAGDYSSFISCLSKKVAEEQIKRLKTEEETSKMMQYEENLIISLESQLKLAESKKKASLSIQ